MQKLVDTAKRCLWLITLPVVMYACAAQAVDTSPAGKPAWYNKLTSGPLNCSGPRNLVVLATPDGTYKVTDPTSGLSSVGTWGDETAEGYSRKIQGRSVFVTVTVKSYGLRLASPEGSYRCESAD